jgi:hypothetical protein
MKKTILLLTVACLLSFPLLSGQQETKDKKADLKDNLSIVTELLPVPDNMKTGFDSINGKDAVIYLSFISSDLLQGRDTASRGYDIAAEYAASMFKLWGIKPAGEMGRPAGRSSFGSSARQTKPGRSYFQTVPLREILANNSMIRVAWQKGAQKKSRTFSSELDYNYFASGTQSFSAPVVFVGYGIQEDSLKLDDYKGIDVKGKIVLMLSETPGKDDKDSPFNKGELKEKYYPARRMRRMTSSKIQLARKMGAVAVIMIENSPQKNGDVFRGKLASRKVNDERPIIPGHGRRMSLMEGTGLSMPWDSVPTIRVSREMADSILGYAGQDIKTLKGKIEKTMKSQSMLLPRVTMTVQNTAETKLVSSWNVLGYIEGSDPELKKEVVVIGAHLDHLGMRGQYIYNGADDNGSGSVGVLEIAEAFAKNPVKPKRSVLFALWTGEEKGLLGSRFYVSNPFFPLDKTVANLNLDMISREWSEDRLKMMGRIMGGGLSKEMMEEIDIKKFISLSFDANASDMKNALKTNNQYVGLHIALRPSKSGMGGSDHAPFAMNKIPWVFFFAAMTEDYHQPTDSIEKVSSKMMQKIMRLAYLTAHAIADK